MVMHREACVERENSNRLMPCLEGNIVPKSHGSAGVNLIFHHTIMTLEDPKIDKE